MKQLRILLITLLALTLAAPAMAINVKFSGQFWQRFSLNSDATLLGTDVWSPEVQPEVIEDVPTGNFALVGGGDDAKKRRNDSDFRHATRVRLTWTAEDDEKRVRGTYGMEVNALTGNGGSGGGIGGDGENVRTRLAYIDFELPFDPATRAYMGLMYAGLNSLVYQDNAAGVKLSRGMGNWAVDLAWFRDDVENGRGGDQKSDYDDLYTLDVLYDFQNGNKIGGFAYYMDAGQGMNTLAAGPYLLTADEFLGESSVQSYWLGLNGAFEQGNLFGGFNAIYQGGEIKEAEGAFDIEAWLLNLEGTAKFGPNYAQLGWVYTRGQTLEDILKDGSDWESYFGIDVSNDFTGSIVALETMDLGAYFYGPYFDMFGANTLYFNLGHELNDKTDLRLGFLWLNSSEDIGLKEFGISEEKNIGYEINGQVDYKITKNLSFSLGAGYLFAGDALDSLTQINNSTLFFNEEDGLVDGDISRDKADDLWRVVSALKLSF